MLKQSLEVQSNPRARDRTQKARWKRRGASESGAFPCLKFLSCFAASQVSSVQFLQVELTFAFSGCHCRGAIDKLRRTMNSHGDMASVIIQADNMIREQKVIFHQSAATTPLLVNEVQWCNFLRNSLGDETFLCEQNLFLWCRSLLRHWSCKSQPKVSAIKISSTPWNCWAVEVD